MIEGWFLFVLLVVVLLLVAGATLWIIEHLPFGPMGH